MTLFADWLAYSGRTEVAGPKKPFFLYHKLQWPRAVCNFQRLSRHKVRLDKN